MTNEQLIAVMEEVKKKTEMLAYSIKIDPERKPEIYQSKFGGVPYWDMEMDYPVDSKGNKLSLLAQINFDEFQHENDDRLPEKGILQFFISQSDDYLYGMDFDNPDHQDSFRVVYHKEINYKVEKTDMEALGIPEYNAEFSPLYGEFAINISREILYMGPHDYRFDAMFKELAEENASCKSSVKSIYSLLEEEQFNMLYEKLETGGHHLLGYPYFTQSDPREYNDKRKGYDTLLFQMDSDFGGGKDYVLWGDSGVANFFINSEDLKNCDFSKVLYNWDCC